MDFLSYCQFKALAPQLTGNRAAGSTGSPVGSSTKSSMASIYDYMHRGSLEYYSALEREGEEGGEEAGSAAPGPAAAEAGETEAALPTPPLPLQAGVETPGFRTTPMPAPPAAASITPLSAMQRRMGRLLLEWVEGNLLEGPAKEVVAARTAQLDVIRVGVRSILEALQGAGEFGPRGEEGMMHAAGLHSARAQGIGPWAIVAIWEPAACLLGFCVTYSQGPARCPTSGACMRCLHACLRASRLHGLIPARAAGALQG